MNSELINKIISKMEKELHPDQLTKLESVLTEIQNEKNSYNNVTKKNNLVKQFISTKRIEGCSNRTEKYYLLTLLFFENNIGQDICTVNTSQIREYLINYQKINNCSNVTLDNIRRILSSC